jgi:medium-chain acyl-[acyl-carrier-protein] hydrolase
MSSDDKKSEVWFQRNPMSNRKRINLFCFPYAGGTASIYRSWVGQFPPAVNVIPVELPGRGGRLNEPLFSSLPPLINVLVEDILPLRDSPFAFFGHSMGAIIAYELARHLHCGYANGPQRLFVSGSRAPQIPYPDPITYNLPKDELIEDLRKLGGTPKEVLDNMELMDVVLPLLRADFQLNQTYKYVSGAKLRCPIIAYGGLADSDVTHDLITPWQGLTTSRFEAHMLPGDHFFLRSSQSLLLELLMRDLCDVNVYSR